MRKISKRSHAPRREHDTTVEVFQQGNIVDISVAPPASATVARGAGVPVEDADDAEQMKLARHLAAQRAARAAESLRLQLGAAARRALSAAG